MRHLGRRTFLFLFAPIAHVFAAGAARANSNRAKAGDNWYGWNWDHPVSVYDATGNPRWDVAGAVDIWSVHGLSLYLTDDEAGADIVVMQGDANTYCNTSDVVIGCGGADVVDGEPVHATIMLNAAWADWTYEQTLLGGTLHEMGHALGFGHAPSPLTNADSVMGVPIPTTCSPECARTTLSNYDRAGVRAAY